MRTLILLAVYAALVGSVNGAENDSLSVIDQEHLERGKRVYVRDCAACHMASGAGMPQAFPKLRQSEMLRRTDDLAKIVLFGKPKSAMPSFPNLGLRDVAALLSYIRLWNVSPLPLVDVEDVAKAAGNGGMPIAEIERRKAQPAEDLPVHEFSMYSLNSVALLKPVALTIPLIEFGRTVTPGGVAGRIMRLSGDRFLMQTNYFPFWQGFEAPKDTSEDGLTGLVYLASCSLTRFSRERGFAGWLVRGPVQSPNRRFFSAIEVDLLNPVKAGTEQKDQVLEVVGLNREFDMLCGRIMQNWDVAQRQSSPTGISASAQSAQPRTERSSAPTGGTEDSLEATFRAVREATKNQQNKQQQKIDQAWDAADSRLIAALGIDPIRFYQKRIAESASRFRDSSATPLARTLVGEVMVRAKFRDIIPVPLIDVLVSSGDARIDEVAITAVLNGAMGTRRPVVLHDKSFEMEW